MVIDVITYNGESELFEIRYNILKDYVDEFIVVEFDKTFSGREKLFFFPIWRYKKVKFFRIREEEYMKYKDLALSSPNTQYGKGAEHWIREFCQKESIKDCLTHLNDNDIVFIGDCDEIWDPRFLKNYTTNPCKLSLRVYTYYLNNRSTEQFYGTFVATYKYIKNKCLNHLRSNEYRCAPYFYDGWHFTSMAPYLRQKLEDSYTEESYATKQVLDSLEENIKNNRDFLGRDFTYKVDEWEWPQWLKDNRLNYKHMLKLE